MRRLAAKGLHALLTDPLTGSPISVMDRIGLAGSLLLAVMTIITLIALSLGLGAGR